MSTKHDHPIIVVGMHRSGTSALAGCLDLLGVSLGDVLLGGNASNPQGYFENQEIFVAHEILFRDLGCRWDMVGDLPEGWLDSEAAEAASKKLTTVIERQFLGRGLWAVKDPRLCRLMPLWSRVLSSFDIEPRFAHLVRHPLEVAKSLQARDGIDLLKGHLLWLVHEWGALQACHERPHVLLTYDQLLADPVMALRKIASSLSIAFPTEPTSIVRELSTFATSKLKHHHTSGGGADGSPGPFADFAWIYEQLRLSQLESIGEGSLDTLGRVGRSSSDGTRGFPLALTATSRRKGPSGRGAVVELFQKLLALIGDFERRELSHLERRERLIVAATKAAEVLFAQVFFPAAGNGDKNGEYADQRSEKVLLIGDEWQTLEVAIPSPVTLRTGRLRIDPLNAKGQVSVASVGLVRSTDGETVWVAEGGQGLSECVVGKGAVLIPREDGADIFCTDSDPQLFLPKLPDLPDCPLRLRVWLKPSRRQTALGDHIVELRGAAEVLRRELADGRTQIDLYEQRIAEKERELVAANEELADLAATLQIANAEGEQFRQEVAALREELAGAAEARDELARYEGEARRELEGLVERLRLSIEELSRKYSRAEQRVRELETELRAATEKHEAAAEQKNTFARQEQLTREYYTSLVVAEQSLESTRKGLREAEKNIRRLEHEKKHLVRWLGRIARGFDAVLSSKRWRTGDALGRGVAALLMRAEEPTAVDFVQGALAEFRASGIADDVMDKPSGTTGRSSDG